jgi:hypothetical protein
MPDQSKFTPGSKVKIVAAKDNSAPDLQKHEGKTGRISACKPTERPVAFLYDVVLDADETTLELLPESCLESA